MSIFNQIYQQSEILGGFYSAYMRDVRNSGSEEEAKKNMERVDDLFDHIRDNY